MIRHLVFAALLLPTPTSLVVTEPGDYVIPSQAIVQVMCFAPDKDPRYTDISAGTAFRIGRLYLSVNHVTNARGRCYIGGKPIKVSYSSPARDFSMLTADTGPFLPIDCGGFVKGGRYLALGFARGLSKIQTVELTGTGNTDHGMSVLYGMFVVVPGMSGGPIVDETTGKVVGTVNSEDFEDGLSWSVPLSDTPLCSKGVA